MLTLALAFLLGGVYPIEILSCYDGDTCTANIHLGFNLTLENQRIRLCDVSAPEMHQHGGRDIRDILRRWVESADQLTLETARRERDGFGRVLGWIYADGENLNQKLLGIKLVSPFRVRCQREQKQR